MKRIVLAGLLAATLAFGMGASAHAPSAQAHGHVKTMQLRWCPKC